MRKTGDAQTSLWDAWMAGAAPAPAQLITPHVLVSGVTSITVDTSKTLFRFLQN